MSISSTSASSVLSQSIRPQHKPPSFSQLDGNSDGGISLDELISGAPKGTSEADAKKRAEQLLKAMDTDGSGDVSNTEKDAFDTKMSQQRQSMQFMTQQLSGQAKADIFAATDTDGSGGVSLEEFSADSDAGKIGSNALQSLFSLIDDNGDGSINETESSSFFDKLTSALNKQGDTQVAEGGPPPAGPPPDPSSNSNDSDGSDASKALLSIFARNAYQSRSASSDLLTTLTSLLNEQA